MCDPDMITTVSKEHKEYLLKIKKRKILVVLTQAAILAAFFALWEIAAVQKWIDPFIFSQPSRVFSSFISMLMEGGLWRHIGITIWETIAGFVMGTVIGALAAILLWWNRFLGRVMDPYLIVLNSLPKTALAPILIVWLGNNIKSIIATALLISVVVSILTILNGFNQVDREKIKLVQTLGGRKIQTLMKLVIPANVPNIISAMKINVGLSFVGVIVGEFLVAQEGLGYLIVYGSQIFKMDWVMICYYFIKRLKFKIFIYISVVLMQSLMQRYEKISIPIILSFSKSCRTCEYVLSVTFISL